MHTWYGHMVSTHGKHTWYPHMVCTHGRQAVCVCGQAGREYAYMYVMYVCYTCIYIPNLMCSRIRPKKITLTQTHRILFLPKDDQGTEISAHSFGVKCDYSYWGSDMSQVMWHVRWTQKGLMPVKPAVHLTNRVSLPAGRALLLKSESS